MYLAYLSSLHSLSLASEQTLKDLKKSQGHQRGGEKSIWLIGPSGLHRNSPEGLNISSIRVFDQTRDTEIPITLRTPHLFTPSKIATLVP